MDIKARVYLSCMIIMFIFFSVSAQQNSMSLADRIIVPDACLVMNLNPQKILSSPICQYWMKKSGADSNTGYNNFVSVLKKYRYRPEDIRTIALTSGAMKGGSIKLDGLDKNKFYFSFGACLEKAMNVETLYKILKDQVPSDDKNVTISRQNYNDSEIIKIHTDKDMYFTAFPSEKIIVAADYDTIKSIIDGKKNPPISIPEKLAGTIQYSASDDCYLTIVVPESVAKELSSMKKPGQPLYENSLFNANTEAFKDFKALVLKVNSSETLNAQVNAYFSKPESADSVAQMIKTFLPLVKFQLMLRANGQPLPFINNLDGGPVGQGSGIVTLHATLSKADIDTLTAPVKRSQYNIGGKTITL